MCEGDNSTGLSYLQTQVQLQKKTNFCLEVDRHRSSQNLTWSSLYLFSSPPRRKEICEATENMNFSITISPSPILSFKQEHHLSQPLASLENASPTQQMHFDGTYPNKFWIKILLKQTNKLQHLYFIHQTAISRVFKRRVWVPPKKG